jgi:D-glycero-D-manno-heptose 1,7-bisphosphate phosphatase
MKPGVFLDRDGVINYNRPDYVKCWEEFEFLPNTLSALRRLAAFDWPVIVITNQSIIGRAVVSRSVVDDIHERMRKSVANADGRIDDILCCPHRPDEDCECRKPKPGLLLRAAAQYSIDLRNSYLIGDAESDLQAARAAGCQAIFVKSGRGNELLNRLDTDELSTIHVEDDLDAAVQWIASVSRIGRVVREIER